MKLSELITKDVINEQDGLKLGKVYDLEIMLGYQNRNVESLFTKQKNFSNQLMDLLMVNILLF